MADDINGVKLKVRAKVQLEAAGTTNYSSIKFTCALNSDPGSGTWYGAGSDQRSSLGTSWAIIEEDFDISSWNYDSDHGVRVALQFTPTLRSDSTDTDLRVRLEWIEITEWVI